MKKILTRMGTMLSCLALMVTVANMNAACFCIFHQPELPESAKKLRKF